MTTARLAISEAERILCAYAEPANGPGWSNRPIWVIVADANGKLRMECIQPEDQTASMVTLYAISAATHREMTYAVQQVTRRKKVKSDALRVA